MRGNQSKNVREVYERATVFEDASDVIESMKVWSKRDTNIYFNVSSRRPNYPYNCFLIREEF